MGAVGILLVVLCALVGLAFSTPPGQPAKYPKVFAWSCIGITVGVLLLLASLVTLAWRHMP